MSESFDDWWLHKAPPFDDDEWNAAKTAWDYQQARIDQLEAERRWWHEQYQRAEYYRAALIEIRDKTPAYMHDEWPHHHWYLNKASKAINHHFDFSPQPPEAGE